MKKILFSFILCAIALSSFAQVKGDLFAGANSKFSGRVVDLTLSPVVGYQVTDNIQVGANVVINGSENTNFDWFQAYGRYYVDGWSLNERSRTFVHAAFGTSASDSYSSVSAGFGVTAFLGKSQWFYVEPQLGWNFSNYSGDTNSFGFSLGCGVRL